MTSATSTTPSWLPKRASFDAIYQTAATSRLSFDEAELLKDSHWDLGEDARLREDIRFRMTPWGRWIAANLYLANDAVFKKMHHEPQRRPPLDEAMDEFDRIVGRRCVFCTGDPRFVLDHGTLRLAVSELSEHPLIEDNVTDIEKYVTHLPLHSLKAAAASEPAGEWGGAAQEDVIETLGWMRVSLPGRRLNPMMFVARIEGHSMDNGRSGLADGSYTVFELWPAGSRQNMNVLVRGAFTDPESGSYAVKKYVADQRDEEGRHHNVTLVSLNPDKVRYPDIELAVEQDDDVAVVAKVIQALSPVDFARLPKKVRITGRRDLKSQDLIEDISKSLARHAERFFAHPACDSGDEEELARKRWASEIVCLEPEAGGLHIEVGALDGLWKFVKKLCLVGSQGETFFLASNARNRRQRLCVHPSSGPWKIEPVGFEDDPDVDLSALDSAALDPELAVAFRVDAEGVGRRVASGKLSPGQEYRLLVPPLVLEQLQLIIEMAALPDGWHIWELAIPLDLPIDLERQLTTLGFRLGCPQPQMTWVLVPAVAWRTTPKGIPYPCFLGQSDPVVAINGLTLYLAGEALFFIHGPTGTSTTELPVEEELMVQLRNLAPGRYAAALIHRNTSILPARMAFEVIDESPKPPSARWAFTSAEQMLIPENDSVVVVGPQDLRVFDIPDDDSITNKLELPPGWPVQLTWREVSEDYIGSVSATLDGEVDLDWVATLARERWQRRSVGDLVMDFRELGCLILSHDQSPDPDKIKMELGRIVSQRGPTANSLPGTSPELQKMWFEPVCRLLGYDMEPIVLDDATFPPDNVCLFRLIHTHRFDQTIKRQAARLLAVVESLPTEPSEELSTWIDAVSAKEGLWDIIFSDGLKWAVRRRGSRLALDVLDLKVLLNDHGRFIGFLRAAAEGV